MNALVLVAALACGQSFTVTNKMPTEFKVVNRCQPCSICDDCRCQVCECAALEKRLAAPMQLKTKVTAFPQPPVLKTQTVIAHAASSSHTHACPNPSCPFRKANGEPFVWNHSMNSSHECPYCHAQQMVVSGRPVTIARTVQVAQAAPVAAPPVTLATLQASTVSSSACASGNCATTVSSPVRRGLFRR